MYASSTSASFNKTYTLVGLLILLYLERPTDVTALRMQGLMLKQSRKRSLLQMLFIYMTELQHLQSLRRIMQTKERS